MGHCCQGVLGRQANGAGSSGGGRPAITSVSGCFARIPTRLCQRSCWSSAAHPVLMGTLPVKCSVKLVRGAGAACAESPPQTPALTRPGCTAQ